MIDDFTRGKLDVKLALFLKFSTFSSFAFRRVERFIKERTVRFNYQKISFELLMCLTKRNEEGRG